MVPHRGPLRRGWHARGSAWRGVGLLLLLAAGQAACGADEPPTATRPERRRHAATVSTLGPGYRLALNANVTTVLADGAQAIPLVATLTDWRGKPISGATIAFGASGSANDTFAPARSVTNCAGVARSQVASSRASLQSLSATYSQTTAQLGGTFTCPGPFLAPGGWPVFSSQLHGGTLVDLDRDGRLDIVTPTISSNTLSVLLGNGNASFNAPVTYPIPSYGSNVAAGDLNNDGKPDVVVPNYNSATVSVLMGRGDGTLGPAAYYATGTNPQPVVIADLNADNNMDVAVGHYTSAFVSVYLGRGDGTLQARVDYATPSGPIGLAVGDMNRDNKLDLVVANIATANNVSLLYGSGSGTFSAASNTAAGGTNPYAVTVGDLNRDGNLDAVVSNINSSFLSVLLNNNGTGVFTSVTNLSGSGAVHGTLADFNGDGNLDLVATTFGSSLALTYAGNGNGTLTPGASYTLGTAPRVSLVADLNGDGNVDIASFSQTSGSVGLLLGTGHGSFRSTQNARVSTSGARLAVGRLSSDANVTVLVGHGNNIIETLQVLPDGSFSPPTSYAGPNNGQSVVFGDLNRDNRVDALISFADTARLGVMVGNGNGTFQPVVQYTTAATPLGAAVGDLNKDTYPDVVVACLGIPGVSVLLGNAVGSLGAYTTYASAAATPYSVAIADFNQDGNNDVVVALAGAAALNVMLGNGSGGLQPYVSVPTPASGPTVAVGLLNNDSFPDIVAANEATRTVSVHLGNGTSSPAAAVAYSVAGTPWTVALGDVNGDGNLDIVSREGVTLSTLFGNGNGTFQPYLSTAAGSGNGLGLYDLNADGLTDAMVNTSSNEQLQTFYASGCQNSSTLLLSASTAASFAYATGAVTFGHAAELRPTFGDNTSSAFTGGTPVGVAYDSSAQALRLGNAGGCDASSTNCATLDASWTPAYGNITHYYRFEGSGTPTAGTSLAAVIGPAATLTGASATYEAARVGSGLNIIGNGSAYVTLPANNPNAAAFTFSGWTKWLGGADFQRLFDFGINTGTYVFLCPSYNPPGLRLAITTSGSGGEARASTAQAMPTNVWTHVAVTLDGTNARVYLNGALATSVATSLTMANVQGASNSFGKSQYPGDPTYNGVLDEVALFNVALNANQIALLYARQAARFAGSTVSQVFGPQSGSPTAWTDLAWNSTLPFFKELPSNGLAEGGSAYANLSSATLSDGQVLLYHFNEATTGTVAFSSDFYDDSGQTSHGLQSGGVTANAPGLLGAAASFPGGSGTVSSRFTYVTPILFTLSAWFASDTTAGGKIVGFGNVASGNSSNYDRHIYMTNAGQLIFATYNGAFNTLTTSGSYNDGRWHQVTAVLSTAGMLLYVDGALKQQNALPGAQAFTGYWRIGGDNLNGWPSRPTSDYFRGRIDEVAVWSRALSTSEVLQLYRRAANRVKLQVRACSSATCADNPNWLGPDGTAFTYFSERNNNVLPVSSLGSFNVAAPSLPFSAFAPSLSVPQNPYLQYRLILESDDEQALCTYGGVSAACSPELQSVRVGPTTYPTSATVTSTTGSRFGGLSSLSATYGSAGCPSGVSFTLSRDGGSTWYYWNAYRWAGADGSVLKSTPLAQLSTTVMRQFVSQVGSGTILFRAFLNSTGSTPCALSQVTLTGTP